jgi:hypothetical protein
MRAVLLIAMIGVIYTFFVLVTDAKEDSNVDKATLAVASTALVLSAYSAFNTWRISSHQDHAIKRQECQALLFDMNKELIRDPRLFAIYDDHPMSKIARSPEDEGRIEAFAYYHANMMEIVYINLATSNWYSRSSDFDAVRDAWHRWTVYLLKNCSPIKKLISDSSILENYNERFAAYINVELSKLTAT